MLEIKFPEKINQRYYEIHFRYLLGIFESTNCKISYYPRDDDALIVGINGVDYLFDYWDDATKGNTTNLPRFKFHCIEESDKTFAFTPVSFYDWHLYEKLKGKICYKAKGLISSRQRPYGGATSRRSYVHRLLKEKYDDDFVFNQIPHQSFLEEIGDILITVFVPGFCNNMVDRGHLQYLALGCCTISPNLPEILPFSKKLEPDIHYVSCNNNYNDLVEKINWCKFHRKKCIEIGINAKKLFEETSTPQKLCEWIKSKINA